MSNTYETISGKVQSNHFIADELETLSQAFFTVGNETVGIELERMSFNIKENCEAILSLYRKETSDRIDTVNGQIGNILSTLVNLDLPDEDATE